MPRVAKRSRAKRVEASRLICALLRLGRDRRGERITIERIAYMTGTSAREMYRWRAGTTQPYSGRMTALRAFASAILRGKRGKKYGP